jgi:phenylacetate-coenzyme A ligase PaaK-like adenylate-forming protein
MSHSLVTQAVSRVLFPLHERLKGHDSAARRRALERSQWWSPEVLARYRLDRLRQFLTEAGVHVPYYRRLFDETGFDSSSLKGLGEIARIPLLDKRLIRANVDSLKSDRAGPLKRYNTGGSSGEPLIFFMGRDRISHNVAAKWRATRWWGVDVGDSEVVVWGSPIELGAQDRLRALRDRLFRTTLLPAFEMSPSKLDGFIDQIRSIRPRMVFGYPSALAHIARHAARTGRRLDDLGVSVVFVTSEMLYADQRAAIARAFACSVANGYGARDAGFIAHECPNGGMHISAEDVIVEIVGADGIPVTRGDVGEIVVTHLATGDFPFVRYRTGDLAALDARGCPCGRGLPLLKDIQGRTTDFIVAQDGTVMHALALIYVIRDMPGVEQFRIIQHDLDRTEVQLVATSAFSAEHERKIVTDFRSRLGPSVTIEVRRVDRIVPEKSGKYRHVESRIPLAGGQPTLARV